MHEIDALAHCQCNLSLGRTKGNRSRMSELGFLERPSYERYLQVSDLLITTFPNRHSSPPGKNLAPRPVGAMPSKGYLR